MTDTLFGHPVIYTDVEATFQIDDIRLGEDVTTTDWVDFTRFRKVIYVVDGEIVAHWEVDPPLEFVLDGVRSR